MKINVKPRDTGKSIYYQDGGYCFLKNDNYSIAIPVIDPGKKLKTGHIHLDLGSINMSYKGKPFIVDPGTYTYTRDITIRKKCIDYFKHNVPVIKDENMHGLSIPGFFGTEMENRLTVLQHSDSWVTFEFTYFDTCINREIKIEANRIHIFDRAEKPLLVYYHLHPNVIISDKKKNNYLCFREGDSKLYFQSTGSVSLEEYDYSEGYGRNTTAIKVVTESDGKLKAILTIPPI